CSRRVIPVDDALVPKSKSRRQAAAADAPGTSVAAVAAVPAVSMKLPSPVESDLVLVPGGKLARLHFPPLLFEPVAENKSQHPVVWVGGDGLAEGLFFVAHVSTL